MPDELLVAVIDDHQAVHVAVEVWCADTRPPIRLAAAYTSADEFFAAHRGGLSPPDVVLFDLELESRRPAFPVLSRLASKGYRVVVYSHITSSEVILRTLDLGAVTYVSKTEAAHHLIDAIRAAAGDQPYVSPQMALALYEDRRNHRPVLAEREIEVLIAWFQTDSKDLVGRRLQISPSTVRTHLERIRIKYALAGRPAPTKAALVARAIQDGLISVNDL